MNNPTVYVLWSLEFVISSIKSINASDVDLFAQNPYWLSVRSLFFSMNLSSRLLKSFSRILENCGSKETGL